MSEVSVVQVYRK